MSVLTGIDPGLGFNAHYYGPYSATIDGALAQLKNLGFVAEVSTGFGVYNEGFELRRYDYTLTADGRKLCTFLKARPEYGKIKEAVHKIAHAGDPGYYELSIAAKAYYILAKRNKAMANSEIRREAEKSFNWNIQPQSLEKAISFLQQLDLTGEEKRGRAV